MRAAKSRGASGIARPILLQIMRDTCRGVLQMHLTDKISLAHRDIKVENVLFDEYSNRYQLCDFGSATSKFETWGMCKSSESSSESSEASPSNECTTPPAAHRPSEDAAVIIAHRAPKSGSGAALDALHRRWERRSASSYSQSSIHPDPCSEGSYENRAYTAVTVL